MSKNFAVVDTKNHEVRVYSISGKLVKSATFDRSLLPEEVEEIRKDPKAFLGEVEEEQKRLVDMAEPSEIDFGPKVFQDMIGKLSFG